MQHQHNLAVCSIAMASSIHWDKLQIITENYGALETFEKLAKFSLLSTQLLEKIHATIGGEYEGCYLYEVDEDFALYFADQLLKKTYSFEGCRLMLGQFAHEFFEMTPDTLPKVSPIIFELTGYKI